MTEKIMTGLLLCGSIAFFRCAVRLNFGTFAHPGSGLWPTLASGVSVLAAALLLWRSQREAKPAQPRPQPAQSRPDVLWIKFNLILIGFVFYLFANVILPYFATTFILLFYLFKISDTRGWIVPLACAAASSACFYLVFKLFLHVALP